MIRISYNTPCSSCRTPEIHKKYEKSQETLGVILVNNFWEKHPYKRESMAKYKQFFYKMEQKYYKGQHLNYKTHLVQNSINFCKYFRKLFFQFFVVFCCTEDPTPDFLKARQPNVLLSNVLKFWDWGE